MADPHEQDPESLQIRCPSCGQKFKVGHDLQGRMVECGTCETQFRVNDETILRAKKFYPGEHRDPRLHGFGRRPMEASGPVHIPTTQYHPEPHAVAFEPPGAQRTIAGVVAVVMMISIALLLGFGAHQGRALDGVSQTNRLILAGFAGALGGLLLIYANPRGRKKAVFFALLFCSGLVAMPFIFTEASEPLAATGGAPRATEEATPVDDSEKLAKSLGLEPLIAENLRLAEKGGDSGRALGLWLREMKESNKLLIRDHLVRETGADPDSNLYVRDRGDWLMVLSGVKRPIEEIAAVAGKLGRGGKAERIYPELNLVEIMVDNSAFVEGPIEKLNDKSSPAFYELNKRELDSIDPDRARRAVKRLADAEPKIYREDIVRRLSQLLRDADATDAGHICQALMTWSTPEQTFVTHAVINSLKRLHAEDATPPREMIAFLVARKETSIAPILDEIWAKDHTSWEQYYSELGPSIEPLVLSHLSSDSIMLRHSAVRLLGRVGTPASLPKLEALRAGAATELRVLIDRAVAAISQRGGKKSE
jgi:hypothetical protein